ncbi:MAG: HAMP domain-containing histidine kinase [Pseudonocardiales bacterium]|nr:HAMP domain-containing histidine kinase [Pseudonocardiales bacterium]
MASGRVRQTLAAPLLAVLRPLVNAWQVSLQARVVLSTLLLGTLVLSLTAWLMLTQISDGLVDSKRDTSLAQAEAAFSEVQQDLEAAGGTGDTDTEQVVNQLVGSLANRSGSPPAYVVTLDGPLGDEVSSDGVRRSSAAVSEESVPTELQAQVRDQPGTWWTYTDIDFTDDSQSDGAGIAVGARVQTADDSGDYALYYLYPFAEEERTLGLVAQAVLLSGVVLMLLVAGVAWLVTRQVVTPVRLARRIAERLASGRLEERMQVRGKDDIARLGQSFNQMAGSLQRQIRQLEELSRLQRRFVSDVSHELRTPLTTVRMAADVLHEARPGFDPATGRSAELLQAELDRFEALLADLLEISRFDAGAARLDITDVDLGELARREVDAQRAVARQGGVQLDVVAPVEPVMAQGDPRRIERVVRNLLANAIAHARSRRVEVIVAADDEAAALAVRDHGSGLHPGEAALVFNRFWRGDPARARRGGGTGLGLAIALEDAQLHGGWLQAWGEPDRGSQFRLTIPRRAGDDLRRSPIPLVPDDLSVGRPYETTSGPLDEPDSAPEREPASEPTREPTP